jgi:hypothetical protein
VLPAPVLPAPAVAPVAPVVEAMVCTDAPPAGATETLGVAPLVAWLSSTLASTAVSRDVGQTLNETRPTRVTKTIAAPANTAPDAPIPTMKLSGVLFFDVLVAA